MAKTLGGKSQALISADFQFDCCNPLPGSEAVFHIRFKSEFSLDFSQFLTTSTFAPRLNSYLDKIIIL